MLADFWPIFKRFFARFMSDYEVPIEEKWPTWPIIYQQNIPSIPFHPLEIPAQKEFENPRPPTTTPTPTPPSTNAPHRASPPPANMQEDQYQQHHSCSSK